MSVSPPASIGFAAGLLGAEAIRMDLLAHGPGWVALDKPSGVAFEEHPWQNGAPTILGQLRLQLAAGKPEMVRLGLAEPAAVFGPEPETAGIVLLADRTTTMATWRDALGSGAFKFEYEFIARVADAPEDPGLCDLPVGMDDSQGRAFVSHRNGKQAETRFEPGRACGPWRIWTAQSPFPRRDQVRIHASECGIRIAGELKYGRSGRVTLTDTTPKGRLNKGEDKPLHRGLLLRLARVVGKLNGQRFEVVAPPADDFAAVVKRLSKGL